MTDSITFQIRQGDLLPAITVQVFNVIGAVDLTAFSGGITFRMVKGTTVITGAASGTSGGLATYQWQNGNTDIAGIYAAVFVGIDGGGRHETFPTAQNLSVVIVAAI